jgi:hypothetical protein
MRTLSIRVTLSLCFRITLLIFATCCTATASAQIVETQLVDNPMEVGAPKLPKYVLDDCARQNVWPDAAAQSQCLNRFGFPSDRKPLPKPAACTIVDEIPSWKWLTMTKDIQGKSRDIFYRTSFILEPINSQESRPSYRLHSFAEIDLVNLQNMMPGLVKQNMPPNGCEADTVITDQSEQLAQGAYHFKTRFRTDISICTRGPCFPNVLDECTSRTDVGQVESHFNMRISARLEDDTLVIRTDNDLEPGDKPSGVELLQGLERLWNNLTGNLTRAGAAAKYDDAIRDAVNAAILTSDDLAHEKLIVPGMAAYQVKMDSVRLRLVTDQGTGRDRLRLEIRASAEIPNAAVCPIQKKLEDLNGVHSGR